MSSSREQFEAWARNQKYVNENAHWLAREGDAYCNVTLHLMWTAWQASRAVPIVLPAMQEAKDSHCLIYSEGWNDALNEVKDALIAQGYTVAN